MKLEIERRLILSVTTTLEQKLRELWNERIADPFAFIPHELRGKISQEKALTENNRLGKFASRFLRRIFQDSSDEDKTRRTKENKVIVAVGFGKGYDSNWFAEATLAGYTVWWIDVSDFAFKLANYSMDEQWVKMKKNKKIIYPRAEVRRGEIQSILENPSSIGLDISKVEVWYFCRTVTCMSQESAEIVLRMIGEFSFSSKGDPNKKNSLVVVSALRDDNPHREGKTSTLYTKEQLLQCMTIGAKRPVEISDESTTCKYFTQKYRAFSIRAS